MWVKPTLKLKMQCPKCQSQKIHKRGKTHSGKPRFGCVNCGHVFSGNPTGRPQIKNPLSDAERSRRYRERKKKKNE
jgi:uncharacterized Zn finger protein